MNRNEKRKTKNGKRKAKDGLLLFVFRYSFFVFSLCSMRAEASSDSYLNYLRGLSEERAGNISKALDAYEKVVAEDPQALEAYKDIAQLDLRLGQADAAVQAAEKVRDLAPKDPSSFLFLGNVLVAQGNLAKAAEAYEQALQLDPHELRALENLANYYSMLDPLKAFSYYQRYLEIDPNDGEIYFQLGLLQQKDNKIKEAEESFKRSSQLEPEQLGPHLALAEIYESQKSTASAVAEYVACAQVDPHNPLVALRLGHLYYEQGQWDLAYNAFQSARAAQPEDAPVYYWLARVCEERKQWKEAAEHSQKAYELSHDVQFLPLIAYYLTLDGRPKEAGVWLEKARKIDPENPNVLLFLGMNYLDLDKPEKAIEILTKAVGLYPHDAQLHFQLGVAQDKLNHDPQAVEQFQTVLTLDPKNSAAMNYLGYSWAEKGVRLEEAEKLLRQAVELDPTNGAFLDSLAWVRHKRGDDQEAVSLLEKAVVETPDPLIYDHLGDVFLAMHRPDRALEAWNKALAMDPKNEAIRKKAADAASHVMPGTDQRKYLKYFEGNMRQISTLSGRVVVRARWQKHPVQAQGNLAYVRPDHLTFTLMQPGKPPTPAAELRIQGDHVQVDPPAMAQGISTLSLQSLAELPKFFSGDITQSLDSPDVTTTADSDTIHYTADHQEAWMGTRRGMLKRYAGDDPQGGRDEIEVKSYSLVEGLWLPDEMRLRNRAQGWDARVRFSEWTINR